MMAVCSVALHVEMRLQLIFSDWQRAKFILGVLITEGAWPSSGCR